MQVSTPGSPQYGQFYTQEAITNLVAPHPDAVQAVVAWLLGSSSSASSSSTARDVSVTANQDFVVAHMTVAVAEALMPGTRFHTFTKASSSSQRLLRSTTGAAMHLPAPVADAIQLVEGVYDFPALRRSSSRTTPLHHAQAPAAAAGFANSMTLGQSSPAPILNMTLGIDAAAVVVITPLCPSTGRPPASGSTKGLDCPASKQTITAIDVQVKQPGSNAGGIVRIPVAAAASSATTDATAAAAPPCVCGGGMCVCTVGQSGLVNYSPATVTARTVLSDGSTSAWGDSAGQQPTVPSAWVTAETIRRAYSIPQGTHGSASNNSQVGKHKW